MNVWVLVGTVCTGFMPPQGMIGCHDMVGWEKFKTQQECEIRNAQRDPRMVQLHCAEEVINDGNQSK